MADGDRTDRWLTAAERWHLIAPGAFAALFVIGCMWFMVNYIIVPMLKFAMVLIEFGKGLD